MFVENTSFMRFISNILLILSFLAGFTSFSQADNKEPLTRILFIFDASNSMHGKIGNFSKIQVAQKIMSETLDSLEDVENLELALRVYGHQKDIRLGPQDCEDTKLEVPFGGNNAIAIKKKIQTINPKGTTNCCGVGNGKIHQCL
mgnify:CR=1 FL=1